MSVIAVVGATGTIGSRLVRRLAAGGHDVRAICRDPGVLPEGVEPFAADLSRPDEALAALEGATGVYLTPPEAGDTPLALEAKVSLNVVDAAAKHGVEHLVMHTAVRADRGNTGARVLDNKTGIEQAVAASGVGFTTLRPAWYLQNLWGARDYLEQGVVSLPWAGDMVWAATDVEDVVTAAVAFFERGPAGRGYDLHIPGGITGEQIAAAATAVLGHQVSYHQAQVSSRQYVDGFPISDAHKAIYAELFDYFKSDTYLGDPQAIMETLDGFEPRGVEAFLRDELLAGT